MDKGAALKSVFFYNYKMQIIRTFTMLICDLSNLNNNLKLVNVDHYRFKLLLLPVFFSAQFVTSFITVYPC